MDINAGTGGTGPCYGFGHPAKMKGNRMLRPSLVVVVLIVLISSAANAQTPCPTGTTSVKLICLIPQVYGPNGLVLINNNAQALGLASPFQNGLPEALSPLNSSIARQTALLPLASPSSGITFAWDAASKIFVATTDSYGPILGERADTIGKYRVYVGFGYQFFKFDNNDGTSLKNLRAVFTQPDTFASQAGPNGTPITCSLNPPDSPVNEGGCGFIRDIITSKNRVDLKLHQFTTFVTFGLTNRIDVSMAIPIENIRMGITSDATIQNISLTGDHEFPARPDCPLPPQTTCLQSSSSNVSSASGIGDITFRVKGTAWKGEKAAFALGVDVRVPTGDALNFLGAGTAGFTPFAVWSYHARLSPHAFVGYQVNGSSVTAGDISTGAKDKLPGQLIYSGGADVWLTKRISAAFDVVGQQVFQAQRFALQQFIRPRACGSPACNGNELVPPPTPTDPNLLTTTGSYNITNASIGAKIRPFGRVVVTGNVLLKLNDGGLRATAVPLVGVGYTF